MCASEHLVQGKMQLCFCPSKKKSWDDHHYPSHECCNLCCFEGQNHATSDNEVAGEFYTDLAGKKCVLWAGKYG